MLGGMMMPIVEAVALTAPANRGFVPLLLHGRDQDGTQGGAIRDRRAGDAAHDHVGDDGDVGQAAPQMAHQRARQVDDALGQAAGAHQVSGQHEKRDGHEGKGIHAGKHPLKGDKGRKRGLERNVGQGNQPQGERHGHADEQKSDEDDRNGHFDSPPVSTRGAMASPLRFPKNSRPLLIMTSRLTMNMRSPLTGRAAYT